MSGLEGGVSAFNVASNSGNITIAGDTMTGSIDVAAIDTVVQVR